MLIDPLLGGCLIWYTHVEIIGIIKIHFEIASAPKYASSMPHQEKDSQNSWLTCFLLKHILCPEIVKGRS